MLVALVAPLLVTDGVRALYLAALSMADGIARAGSMNSVLDISTDSPPHFDNFVAGGNAAWSRRCGKPRARRAAISHLGRTGLWPQPSSPATVAAAHEVGRPAHFVAAADVGETPDDEGLLLAADDVDALGDAAQVALFNGFNRAHAHGQTLLLGGDAPPFSFGCAKTCARALASLVSSTAARRRGARAHPPRHGSAPRTAPGPGGRGYLLRHGRRDMPSLVAVVNSLDASSLEQKRPVTLPLLRELMQRGLTSETRNIPMNLVLSDLDNTLRRRLGLRVGTVPDQPAG